jgi:hypothetical protein
MSDTIGTKTQFMKDLNEVYEISSKLNSNLNAFYKCFENKDTSENYDNLENPDKEAIKKCEFIDSFIESIGFKKSPGNRVSVIRKLVSLRDDFLISAISDEGVDEISKKEILSAAYSWAGSYHINMFEELIFEIEERKLLTPFYRELIKGVKLIGLSFTQLDVSWESTINDINSILLNKFDNDLAAAVSFVCKNNLMDKLPDGSPAERCYSILVEDKESDCGFSTQSYGKYFEVEVDEICSKYNDLILVLSELSDDVFFMKEQWINYFEALSFALSERDCDKLISVWRDVDYAWMEVKSPIQIGHCMEYYNDNIRNCVEIEWDLRIVNPDRNDASKVTNSVENMYESYMNENSRKEDNKDIYDASKAGLGSIQLYVGKPLMYFAKFFSGLFSAQVVPNDEVVSSKFGKKIFAFADFVLENEKAAPAMKLSHKVFGKEFLDELKFVCDKPDIWHKVYSISTIGHELGHILWKGTDSEVKMNGSGNFKMIEEYKATTGGLVAFFKSDEVDEFWKELFYDVVERSVKLVAWKKTESVCAYYCEGLIHLTGLFETGVLKFDKDNDKLNIDMSREKFDAFAGWTIKNYEKLFNIYLKKVDATKFLENFAKKDSENYFMPVDETVCEFVKWYYNLYETIGRETL